MTERLQALRTVMAESGTDLVALGPSSHMRWLAGVEPHGDERPVLLLVSAAHAGFLMPSLNADSVRQHTDLPFNVWRDEDGPDAALRDLLAACGVAGREDVSVVVDETMRADFALTLLDALPGARRRFTDDTVGRLRATKDAREYDALKASALLNDRVMQAGFDALRTGVTEREIADVIRAGYKAAGARPEFVLVCFGANGAFPHHHTGDTRLEDDMAVLVDTGGRLGGYPSDMTRCLWFGTPDPRWSEAAGIVDEAVEAALAAAKPGVPAHTVDAAARGVIEAAGYGAAFIHRTGHGLGLDIHEPPYITSTSNTVLEPGMVFSIEPGIYLPGAFGIRLEEIVFLRDDGPEILSEMPRRPQRRGSGPHRSA